MQSPERYSRQIQVNKIGASGQQKLNNSSVLIIGAGGLGCQVGVQLAGAGVGKITLIDHDDVSLSNLHRQILFREGDIGQTKSLVAARELMALNNEIEIHHQSIKLNKFNLAAIADGATIVIDAADNFITSYLLSDYCSKHRIPLVCASVNSTFGWVGVFCGSEAKPLPSVRAVFPRLNSQLLNCDTVGVTGPSVGIVASIQAQEVLKVALNDDSHLGGKLLYLDLWRYQQHVVDFTNAVEPDEQAIQFISAAELSEIDLVIDVRNAEEVITAPFHYSNLLTIPLPELAEKISNISRDKPLVLACASGQRALLAAQILLEHDFRQLSVLAE